MNEETTGKTVEEWCAEKKTDPCIWGGAKWGNRWPIGKVLTESDYDAAIEKAAHTSLG